MFWSNSQLGFSTIWNPSVYARRVFLYLALLNLELEPAAATALEIKLKSQDTSGGAKPTLTSWSINPDLRERRLPFTTKVRVSYFSEVWNIPTERKVVSHWLSVGNEPRFCSVYPWEAAPGCSDFKIGIGDGAEGKRTVGWEIRTREKGKGNERKVASQFYQIHIPILTDKIS